MLRTNVKKASYNSKNQFTTKRKDGWKMCIDPYETFKQNAIQLKRLFEDLYQPGVTIILERFEPGVKESRDGRKHHSRLDFDLITRTEIFDFNRDGQLPSRRR